MSDGTPYDQDQVEFFGKVAVERAITEFVKPAENQNPKNAAAVNKPSTYAIPPIAILALGAAMKNGADKYGPFNWRQNEVIASVFIDAINRHFLAWQACENNASDSGIHHLAHIMANCAILLDAIHNSVFNDDRSKSQPILDTPITYKIPVNPSFDYSTLAKRK